MVAVVCRDALILVVAFHSNLPSNVVAIQDFDPRNAFHSNLPSTVVAVPNFEDFLLLLLLVVVVVVVVVVEMAPASQPTWDQGCLHIGTNRAFSQHQRPQRRLHKILRNSTLDR